MAAETRETVRHLLGGRVGTLDFAEMSVTATGAVADTQIDTLEFVTPEGVRVPAQFLHPRGGGPAPAVLYCHAHGGRYDIGLRELTEGRPALQGAYLGDLAAAGYAVLCVEMPCFGSRSDVTESAASKALLWRGTTLFGEMLAEQAAGLAWLSDHPEVDATRIAALGISMGGTLAWWLGALDRRVSAVVSMCSFADLACLIESGAHDGHGHYMTVPGLLRHLSTGTLAGLCAPRPQLQCVGLQDGFTSPECFAIGRRDLEAAYAAAGASELLEFHVEPDAGHEETPEMRLRVLDFLARSLGSAAV